MPDTYLLSISEITLKGKNRAKLQRRLETNLQEKLPQSRLQPLQGRILLQTSLDPAKVTQALKTTFGIANFAACQTTPTSQYAITKAAVALVKKEAGETFALKSVRIDKKLPFTSDLIHQKVGESVRLQTQKRVDLTHPNILCRIFIDSQISYISTGQEIGPSGLPTGSSAPLLGLISGGIDSPVAIKLMMGRGSHVDLVHFHSYPQTNRASIAKVKDICRLLAQYQGATNLTLIPILDIQKAMLKEVDHSYLVILYRRAMLRLAEKVAQRNTLKGLVTGDSLGQVASQTVENLVNQDHAVDTIIFRPLIGLDKQAIIDLAQDLGSYAISIAPHQDCCSLFVPKHPKTRTRLNFVEKEEGKIENYSGLLEQALEQSTTEVLI